MTIANPLTVHRGDYRYIKRRQDVACLASDSVGDCVCIRGDMINDKWRVQKADPFDSTKMPAVGILIEKSTPTVGVVQWIGPCNIFSGLIPGKIYHVGLSGLTIAPPVPGGLGYSMAQIFGYAVAPGILVLTGNMLMTRRVA